MKYRRLSISELEQLRAQFVGYIASQGINADEWQKLKAIKSDRVDHLIEEFSDMVYEASIQQLKHLIMTEGNLIYLFEMSEENPILYVFKNNSVNGVDNKAELDIRNDISFMSKAFKAYSKSRNEECFDLLESGCKICPEQTYQVLIALTV